MRDRERLSDEDQGVPKREVLKMLGKHFRAYRQDEEPQRLRRHLQDFREELHATEAHNRYIARQCLEQSPAEPQMHALTESDQDIAEEMWLMDPDTVVTADELSDVMVNSRSQ